MDPFTGYVTIVPLVAEFVSQRKSKKDASLKEFKDWLANQRHEDIIMHLDSNTKTTISIKALLHESHSVIVSQLEQLRLQMQSSVEQPSQTRTQVAADVFETIVLGINNSYVGTASDISDLATRCAVYAIEGKRIEFQIELQKTVLNTSQQDPLMLAQYEKARLERAQHLKMRLELLTSKAVYEWWGHFLSRKEDWAFVVQWLILRADFASNGVVSGQKIDVWRTEKPLLLAPINLSEKEVAETLEHLGFQSINDLCMGAGWCAAIDLPIDLIVKHVIPSIVIQLDLRKILVSGDVLNLSAWHIGKG